MAITPAFNTIYQHYADEVARNATVTIETGSAVSPADDDYGPESLIDDNPAKVAKIDDTTGAWLFEYPAKQVIQVAALIHSNFDSTEGSPRSPNTSVRLEGNNTDSWGSPAFSAEFTIPAWFSTGARRWPVNPYLVLPDLPGYDDDGFFFWRLVVEDNSENLQLGMVWFGETIRRFDPDLRWTGTSGPAVGLDKPQIENRTSFGVSTIYSRGTTIFSEEADLLKTDVMAAALEQHWYDVEGRARPWLLIPSGPISDDRAYLVRYTTTDRQMQWNFIDTHAMRIGVQEVGRGLRPGS